MWKGNRSELSRHKYKMSCVFERPRAVLVQCSMRARNGGQRLGSRARLAPNQRNAKHRAPPHSHLPEIMRRMNAGPPRSLLAVPEAYWIRHYQLFLRTYYVPSTALTHHLALLYACHFIFTACP